METVKKIVTDAGFVDEFWLRVKERQAAGIPVTYLGVYEELNALFEREYGEPKYNSYDAFRMRRDRRARAKQKKRS